MNPDTLRALIARLEAGESDVDFAEDIGFELFGDGNVMPPELLHYLDWIHAAISRHERSVDAAIAFTKAAMPGCMRCSGHMEDGPFATIVRPMPGGGYANGATLSVTAASESVALVLATLKAKLAEVEPQP